jgi:uncharacterized damage-inducible protein DinB
MPLDRDTMSTLWRDSWNKGHGYVPWRDALSDLSPAQALWQPGPQRHSIWAHASHVAFWREYLTASALGEPVPSQAIVASRNFEIPADSAHANAQAWRDAVARVARSHTLVEDALHNPNVDPDVFGGLVAHDAYHLGQIMLLRAMLGLKPLM